MPEHRELNGFSLIQLSFFMRFLILATILLTYSTCSDNASDAFVARLNILAKPVKMHLKSKKEGKGKVTYEIVLEDGHGKYHYFNSSFGASVKIYCEKYNEGDIIADKPLKDNL